MTDKVAAEGLIASPASQNEMLDQFVMEIGQLKAAADLIAGPGEDTLEVLWRGKSIAYECALKVFKRLRAEVSSPARLIHCPLCEAECGPDYCPSCGWVPESVVVSSPASQVEELWRQHLYPAIDAEIFRRYLADTTAKGWDDIRKEVAALRSILEGAVSAAPPALEPLVRAAWEEGFRLRGGYADNWPHFQGEQKERQWASYVNRTPALADLARLRAPREETS